MERDRVVVDYETRSAVELGRGGTNAHNYAEHPTTAMWVANYAFTRDPETVYPIYFNGAMPADLREHVRNGGIISAHNAGFEYAIWNHLLVPRAGWAPLPIDQMTDTAARASRCGLPCKLELAAKAMGLTQQKDMQGSQQMKRLAKPRKKEHCPVSDTATVNLWRKLADMDPMTFTLWVEGDTAHFYEWWNDTGRLEQLYRYGAQDVRTQVEMEMTLPELSASERAIWLSTMKANIRGCRLDVPLVRKAQVMVRKKLDQYAQELLQLTDGKVKSHTDLGGMKTWMAAKGLELDSLDKNVVQSLLADRDLSEDIRRVAEIRAQAGKSSVAKYPAMELHANEGGIAREVMVYYGATATGRWTASGFQLHNLPARGEVGYQHAEQCIRIVHGETSPSRAIEAIETLHDGSVIETLSMCLRGAIMAREGRDLVCADYSNIEGRIGAWFGGERWKLQAFRDYDAGTGPDLYKVGAGSIIGKAPQDVTKDERQVMGKVPELSLQFQGGVGAFVSMGANYGVDMEEYHDVVHSNLPAETWEQALENFDTFGSTDKCTKKAWIPSETIKLAWRRRHPGIVASWRDVEDAAVAAIQHRGKAFHACGRKLTFFCRELFGKPFLLMRLPSGRSIFYANVRLRSTKTPWGTEKATITFDKVEGGRVLRAKTYGGDLFQSAVQGTARDIMANGWLRTETAGYTPLFSVHDEMVSEYPAGQADLKEYEALLCDLPEWARGIPVTADGYVAKRFRKD